MKDKLRERLFEKYKEYIEWKRSLERSKNDFCNLLVQAEKEKNVSEDERSCLNAEVASDRLIKSISSIEQYIKAANASCYTVSYMLQNL